MNTDKFCTDCGEVVAKELTDKCLSIKCISKILNQQNNCIHKYRWFDDYCTRCGLHVDYSG